MKNTIIIRLVFWMLISLCISCTKEKLDIQKAYTFKMTHLPIPSDIPENGTVEIRCLLESKGNYQDTKYTIRFFQNVGKGQLFLEDMLLEIPNDKYELRYKEFRLYYKAISAEDHAFDVYIEDNFGQIEKVEFEFASKANEKMLKTISSKV